MGRGRVLLKRIENKINRQVTFSKRRSGLLKKAHEISVLCDAEVAVIIFSSKGKLYEFSTDSRMEKILELYERYCYAEKALQIKEPLSEEDLCLEYRKLKNKVDALQINQSHLMGEKLDILNMKELQQLEQQLETSVKHIRTHMGQKLLDSIVELQKKEKSLLDYKIVLEKKLIENEDVIRMTQHEQENEQIQDQARSLPPAFLVTNSLPNLNIGAYLGCSGAEEELSRSLVRTESNRLPPWMYLSSN